MARRFAEGGSPQRATIDKLVRWYSSQSKQAPTIPRADLETAIAIVIRYIRDESKPRAVRERRLREITYRLTEDEERAEPE